MRRQKMSTNEALFSILNSGGYPEVDGRTLRIHFAEYCDAEAVATVMRHMPTAIRIIRAACPWFVVRSRGAP